MTGLTYLLTHPGFRAVKVGYTTVDSRRLEELGRRGWESYRSLAVATDELARQIEQATLFEIRYRRYVPHFLTSVEMRSGWTETSSLALITAREAWEIVCEQAGLLQLSPSLMSAPDGRRRNGGIPPRRTRGDCQPNSRIARTQARLEQKGLT
ncbi:hypothetical protein ACF1BS_03435 [Streptomyces sp. NPDC014748]|uniref:hypothetical protein n=1 Tax=Streptomyces sp. NPDC014748 TaxID=3364905 RepID=UPI0036FA0CB7